MHVGKAARTTNKNLLKLLCRIIYLSCFHVPSVRIALSIKGRYDPVNSLNITLFWFGPDKCSGSFRIDWSQVAVHARTRRAEFLGLPQQWCDPGFHFPFLINVLPLSLATDMMVWNVTKDKINERMATYTDEA
jgi:hypothetical protein